MTDPLDAASLIAEVFAWVALPTGVLFLAIGIARRVWASRYEQQKAVITTVHESDARLRWFGEGREVIEAIAPLTGSIPAVGDARTVWVHPLKPDSPRLDDPATDGRAMLIVGGIAFAVGMLGLVAGIAIPFIQG